jgi:Ca-activated chloride channel family protein
MGATDVPPTRLAAAQKAAKAFAQQLTPGVNLGLISFAGTANVLVSPTPQHDATLTALDNLKTADSTATGAAIFAALQSIDTVGAVISSGEGTPPPPARIVLLSDGKENKPSNPNSPQGAYTAARAAHSEGVPISTISYGTKDGYVAINDQSVPVPVDPETMTAIAHLSGGQAYTAATAEQLNGAYNAVEQQIGYQVVPGPASAAWLRLAVLITTIAALLALFVNRRLPT